MSASAAQPRRFASRRSPRGAARARRRTARGLALIAAAAVAAIPPARGADLLPFDALEPGMVGEGLSVFEGGSTESFTFEVVGLMRNVGPKQHVVLARLGGPAVERAGVPAGMSGSPVYVGGKLVGAVASTWSFLTEPLAGVTPIEQLLALREFEQRRTARAVPPPPQAELALAQLARPERLLDAMRAATRELVATDGAGAGPAPMRTPLVVAGFPGSGAATLRGLLDGSGVTVVQGSGAGTAATPPGPIEAGSAFAAMLVHGDLSIAAIGTVTLREGNEIFALGHPLLDLGDTALPLGSAVVHTVLPSLQLSAKMASPHEVVGVLRQDRAAGVYGRLGDRAATIPVRVDLARGGRPWDAFRFAVVDDPLLTPVLVFLTLAELLSGSQKAAGVASIELAEGSTIKLGNTEDVRLANLYSGEDATLEAAATVGFVLHLLMRNADRRPEVGGINLIVDYEEKRRVAFVDRAWVDSAFVRPGSRLEVEIELRPFRLAPQRQTITVDLPEDLAPGPWLLYVGDAVTTSRLAARRARQLPHELDRLVWLVNHVRTQDRVYVSLSRPDGLELGLGAALVDLPPSRASVWLGADGWLDELPEALGRVFEESVATDFAVRGSERLTLNVIEDSR